MALPMKDGDTWLSAVLEHIRDPVIGVDRAGGILWMNPAAERLTGWQEIHALGRRIEAVLDSREKPSSRSIGASVQSVIDSGDAVHESCRELFFAGNRFACVDLTIAPVFKEGECMGTVVVLFAHAPGGGPDGRREGPGKTTEMPEKSRASRVLVMDDDEVVRNLTVQKLIRLGYESEGASNGEEAVFKYKGARDSGKPFDVVVLDLIVRGGMGGKDALEMLIEIDPDVKAILTSGHAVDPVLTNFWEHGFFGVIRKPFVIRELDISIRQALSD